MERSARSKSEVLLIWAVTFVLRALEFQGGL